MPKISNYITKSDLKNALFEQEKSLLKKINEKSKKYRDEILTKMDAVMKELEAMREENALGTHHTSELWGKVDNHEKRITKLETT